MPTLDRAFPFTNGPNRAVLIGHHLHFEVPAAG